MDTTSNHLLYECISAMDALINDLESAYQEAPFFLGGDALTSYEVAIKGALSQAKWVKENMKALL